MISFVLAGLGIWIFGFPWGFLLFLVGIPFDLSFFFKSFFQQTKEKKDELDFYFLAYPFLLKLVSAGGGISSKQLDYLEFILNYANLRKLDKKDILKIRKKLFSLSKEGLTFSEVLRDLSLKNLSQEQINWLFIHANRVVYLKKNPSQEVLLYFSQFKEVFNLEEERIVSDPVYVLDAYGILGCSRSSSIEEIKNNFRVLAKKYHPDLLPSDISSQDLSYATERFVSIFEAYSTIRKQKNF